MAWIYLTYKKVSIFISHEQDNSFEAHIFYYPGADATEKTVAWFGYDQNNIYVVFKCYQSSPVIARNQSRDGLSKNDDLIAFLIDTYNDKRSGYGFFTDSLGTQIDIKINDDGRNLDANWDTEWTCDAGELSESSAWFMRFARENNIYHYPFRYTSIGQNFRDNVNQTGFIRDDDRREIDFEGTYKFWFQNKALKYIDPGSNNNFFWSRETGVLRSWALDNWADFYFNNRFNFKYKYNNEYKLFEKDFYNYQHQFTLGYNTEEWSNASINYTFGNNFDSKFNLINAGGKVKIFQNLSLSYTAQYINFDPDTDHRSTFNNIVTLNFNFTKDLWLKAFGQTSSVDDRVYLYGLFGWRFKPPFGALYLIYSHDRFDADGDFILGNNIFLKITYPLSIIK